MTGTTATDVRHRSRAAARLLLSLLLVVAPLLATAGGIRMIPAGGDLAATIPAEMPCHPTQAHSTDGASSPQQDACPHCADEGLASPCHCCGYAAPAGLGVQAAPAPGRHADRRPLRVAVTDPLPDSPGKRLYRPPIFQY